MGWKTSSGKPQLSSSRSVEINGGELEQIILNTRNSNTDENESDNRLRQHTTITVIGQILRVVGDNLEKVRKDTYEITNYGQV